MFWFGQGALIVSVGDGKNRRFRTGSGAVSGEISAGDGQKKDLRGFSLSSPAHSFFVHLCFDFSFLSCCICIGTEKGKGREYQQGEQFSQGGMTA